MSDHFGTLYINGLNRIAAHNFSRVFSLQAMGATPEYDIVCLLETFLDPLFNSLGDRINIEGCNLLRVDHPNDNERGEVCMYFK